MKKTMMFFLCSLFLAAANASEVQTDFKLESGTSLNSYAGGAASSSMQVNPDLNLDWRQSMVWEKTTWETDVSAGGAFNVLAKTWGYGGSLYSSVNHQVGALLTLEGAASASQESSLDALSPLLRISGETGMEWRNGKAAFYKMGLSLAREQFSQFSVSDGDIVGGWLLQSLSFESGRSVRVRLFTDRKMYDNGLADLRYGGRLGVAQSIGDTRGISLYTEFSNLYGNASLAGQADMPWEESFGYESKAMGLLYKTNGTSVDWAVEGRVEWLAPVTTAVPDETVGNLGLEWTFQSLAGAPFIKVDMLYRSRDADGTDYAALNAHVGRWF